MAIYACVQQAGPTGKMTKPKPTTNKKKNR